MGVKRPPTLPKSSLESISESNAYYCNENASPNVALQPSPRKTFSISKLGAALKRMSPRMPSPRKHVGKPCSQEPCTQASTTSGGYSRPLQDTTNASATRAGYPDPLRFSCSSSPQVAQLKVDRVPTSLPSPVATTSISQGVTVDRRDCKGMFGATMDPQDSNLCKLAFGGQQKEKVDCESTGHHMEGDRGPFISERWGTKEDELLAKQILTRLYQQDVAIDVVVATVQTYPEVAWLTQCASRCPLPPFWTKKEDSQSGSYLYSNSYTGESSFTSPTLPHFTQLVRLTLIMLHEQSDVKDELSSVLSHVQEDGKRAKASWDGPHVDLGSGAQYWFSHNLKCSTWGNPVAAAEFLEQVTLAIKTRLCKETAHSVGKSSNADAIHVRLAAAEETIRQQQRLLLSLQKQQQAAQTCGDAVTPSELSSCGHAKARSITAPSASRGGAGFATANDFVCASTMLPVHRAALPEQGQLQEQGIFEDAPEVVSSPSRRNKMSLSNDCDSHSRHAATDQDNQKQLQALVKGEGKVESCSSFLCVALPTCPEEPRCPDAPPVCPDALPPCPLPKKVHGDSADKRQQLSSLWDSAVHAQEALEAQVREWEEAAQSLEEN